MKSPASPYMEAFLETQESLKERLDTNNRNAAEILHMLKVMQVSLESLSTREAQGAGETPLAIREEDIARRVHEAIMERMDTDLSVRAKPSEQALQHYADTNATLARMLPMIEHTRGYVTDLLNRKERVRTQYIRYPSLSFWWGVILMVLIDRIVAYALPTGSRWWWWWVNPASSFLLSLLPSGS
ncbi:MULTISPECIES: hypothetical protein [Asaia]|uniref:Uncharacterized protein n=3 Tax=Asaia spathodeae TaxID=657016 RepID=A0ABX2P8G6_9PROT